MAALPEPVTDKKPPYWEAWRHQLWQLGQTDDPANFTNWPCCYHTMLVRHWPDAIRYERQRVSHMMPVSLLSFKHDEYDNLIHQAYHLHQWQQTTGRKVADLSTIVEFGGGYGAMCLLCRRLGFKGRYVIYDLPEFSLLQQWYLSQHGVEAEWNPRRKPKDVDLFMALYSLSEVPPEQRNRLVVKAKSYLFLYSGQWEAWDNVEWFKQFAMSTALEWRNTELTHLPDPSNFYTIGW